MNVIDIVLFFIIILELILLFYFITNKRIKRKERIFSLVSIILIIMVIFFYFLDVSIFDKALNQKSRILFLIALNSSIILRLIYSNYELDSKFNKIIKYIVEYEKIIDEQGKKNHEYNNQLMILKGYINNKTKLEEYLETIIEDRASGQNYKIRQLSKFSNGGLKRLLYYKISEIKENKIKYYLYVSEESTKLLERLSVKQYNDLTKIFGVLIDNAIDASMDSNEKEISLDFSIEDNFIVITISNTYNKKIDINKIGKKGFSTKGKGHGFGLKLVKEIIKKNKKLELLTEWNQRYFIQTILVDIK